MILKMKEKNNDELVYIHAGVFFSFCVTRGKMWNEWSDCKAIRTVRGILAYLACNIGTGCGLSSVGTVKDQWKNEQTKTRQT